MEGVLTGRIRKVVAELFDCFRPPPARQSETSRSGRYRRKGGDLRYGMEFDSELRRTGRNGVRFGLNTDWHRRYLSTPQRLAAPATPLTTWAGDKDVALQVARQDLHTRRCSWLDTCQRDVAS